MSRCSVAGCVSKGRVRKGLCDSHYWRVKQYGTPFGGRAIRGEAERYIRSQVDYQGDDCLIWPYARISAGYGTLTVDGKLQYAHRFMCTLVNGPPEDNANQARHTCGKGHLGCINPNHLIWGTRSENQLDRADHLTSIRGTSHPQNKLTEQEVLSIRAMVGQSPREVGSKFGVDRMTIKDIWAGRTWAWFKGEEIGA